MGLPAQGVNPRDRGAIADVTAKAEPNGEQVRFGPVFVWSLLYGEELPKVRQTFGRGPLRSPLPIATREKRS
jgi:hypothetical protein